jgi:hypothetical protein
MADSDIVAKLNMLNTTYLNSINNAFLGSSTFGNYNISGTTNCATLQCQIMNYIYTGNNAVNLDNTISIANNANLPAADGKVCIYPPPATAVQTDYKRVLATGFQYSQAGTTPSNPCNDTVNFSSTTCPVTTDINCMSLLLTPYGQTTPISSIPLNFFCLQGLYAWYAMFDKINWMKYSSGQTVTFSIPDIQVGGTTTSIGFTQVTIQKDKKSWNPISTSTLNSQMQTMTQSMNTGTIQTPPFLLVSSSGSNPTIVDIMKFIIPFTNTSNSTTSSNGVYDQTPVNSFDPFTARRIMHLHIIMAQFQIAYSYISVTVNTNLEQITYAIAALLESSNNTLMDPTTGGFINILNAVQMRSQQYNTDQTQITSLNKTVQDLQSNIAIDSNKLSQEIIYQNTIKNYQYVAFILLLIVLFSFIGMYVKKTPATRNALVASGLTIISIIITFVLNYYLQTTLASEGFYSTPNINQSVSASGLSYVENFTVTDDLNTTKRSILIPNARAYLDNTLALITALNNYNLFGQVNIGMNNQFSYYNDAAQSLAVKDTNIKNYTTINYIEQINYAARMNFALALSIILSISAAAYFGLDGSASSQGYVRILALLFIFGAFFAYVLEIMTHVHTHPKQKYWVAPKMTTK